MLNEAGTKTNSLARQTDRRRHFSSTAVGMGIPVGIPMGMGMGWVWYGDRNSVPTAALHFSLTTRPIGPTHKQLTTFSVYYVVEADSVNSFKSRANQEFVLTLTQNL